MHPELLKATVQACRDYIEAGDCHGAPPPIERLINAVVQLADALSAAGVDAALRAVGAAGPLGDPDVLAAGVTACQRCGGRRWVGDAWENEPCPDCAAGVGEVRRG